MTKKHFIALADALRPVQDMGLLSDEALDAIIDFCKAQNSEFKADRWLGYLDGECGKNGGKVKKVVTV